MSVNQKIIVEIQSGSHQGKRYSFSGERSVRIGSDETCDICFVDDPSFVEAAAQLKITSEGCHLQTLSIRMKAMINGTVVEKATIQNGDIIQLGNSKFVVFMVGTNANQSTTIGQESLHSPSRIRTVIEPIIDSPLPAVKAVARQQAIVIPGYSIVRTLGHGGMGTVFEATRSEQSENVAIKIINPGSDDRKGLQLFSREASILSTLNHPNVVRFLAMGQVDQQVFLVMEYIDCVDVTKLLSSASAKSRIRLACGIARQVLSALHHAHQHNIVHRDIKPSNILVCRKEGKLLAKVSDFGLAKNFQIAGFSAMTADGETRGTLAFMAPEQFQNCRYVKPTADVYAVGATLFKYLSGRPPVVCGFKPKELNAAFDNVPAIIQSHLAYVPIELRNIISKSMSKNPAKRFASAKEMRDLLKPFASSQKE